MSPTQHFWPEGSLRDWADQRTRNWFPSTLPPFEQFLESYRRGWVSDELYRVFPGRYGIPVPGGKNVSKDSQLTQAWQAIREAGHRRYTPQEAFVLRMLDVLTDAQFDLALERSGITPADRRHWQDLVALAPDPITASMLSARGIIDNETFNRLIALNGGRREDWAGIVSLSRRWPTITEVTEMFRREHTTFDKWKWAMERNGVDLSQWEKEYRALQNEIPPISDLIRFQVREVFNPQLAASIRLFDERPEHAAKWMAKLGYRGPVGFDIQSDGVNRPGDWSDLYWGAHWQPISPTQAYTMLHRLRPERMDRYRATWPQVQPFRAADVERWLRIADYPPGIRQNLGAISYLPLRLTDIRTRLKDDPTPENQRWAHEQLQDRGNHPEDSWTIVQFWVKQVNDQSKKLAKKVKADAPGKVWAETLNGYTLGAVTRQTARQVARGLGLEEQPVEATLDALDAKRKHGIIRAAIAQIKSKYVAGVLNGAEVREQLTGYGIDADRAADYAQLWKTQRDGPRKLLSVSEAMDALKRGIISDDEGLARLRNLGYPERDATILLARAFSELQEINARAALAGQAQQKAAAKEVQAAMEKANALGRRLQGDLRALTPVATLKQWLKARVIGATYFRERMAAMGYPPDVTELHLRQVIAEEIEDGTQEAPPPDQSPDGTGTPGHAGPNGHH